MNVQLFPALDPATEAALRCSIERHGVLMPIIVDTDGTVLDGHHRQRIADDLKVDCPYRVVECEDRAQREEIARTLNEDRRHILPADLRRPVVAELRAEGHSLRAIGNALGVSLGTVQRDLDAGVSGDTPAEVVGRDGKTYPASRPADLGRTDTQTAIEGNLEDSLERAIMKPDVGGGISHPARYTDALIPVFAEYLDGYDRVLDPFAGTGQRLAPLAEKHDLVGVELEPEWARISDWVEAGNALDLRFADESFDAICTSPTYGNRLADHHNASDPETRRSYTHDLGRTLHPDNSGALHWGTEYREFHCLAWAEAVRVLSSGGRFLLNIKDHIRAGEYQDVSGWHVGVLLDLGLSWRTVRLVGTSSLRAGENAEARVPGEFVFVLDKP